jgi:dTDP-4-dehydrorhamnose 3,5-epimerase
MDALRIIEQEITGLALIETTAFEDHRGAFARFFCARELAPLGLPGPIVQVNHSRTSARGAVRGLHFQHPPMAEVKIVRCLRGRIFDVAVDLRLGSPTFLQWRGVELTPESRLAFCVPRGFAHGFQALEPDSEILYLTTEYYSPEHEDGVRFDDPAVGVRWPLPLADISTKDAARADLRRPDGSLRLPGIAIV